MAIEPIDATEPQTRDFSTIRRDVTDLDIAIRDALKPLHETRREIGVHLNGQTPGGEAWKAIIDEHSPRLDTVERQTMNALKRRQAQLQQDRDHLRSLGYRSGLPADQQQLADAKAAQLATLIQTQPAAAVARNIKGAVTFNDTITMAAYAQLADAMAERFPPTSTVRTDDGKRVPARQLFADLMAECERKTADPRLTDLRDTLDEAANDLNHAISDLTNRRVAHDPTGGFGSPLLSTQFGMRDGDRERRLRERRYDVDAVYARLGR